MPNDQEAAHALTSIAATPRSATIVDVALRAGVTRQTVSRVANEQANVLPDTRRKVLAAMEELRYRPNVAARSLRSGNYGSLGVTPFGTLGGIEPVLLDAITRQAGREGFSVTLVFGRGTAGAPGSATLDRHGELAIDGLIVVDDSCLPYVPPDVPVVVIDGAGDAGITIVDTDQTAGVHHAVHHLLAQGHRTVWHVAGPDHSPQARCRAAAWRAALSTAGRPTAAPQYGDWSFESGYLAGLEMAPRDDCTAVFAANDRMAVGLVRAFQETGRHVPRDVSVIGFGGSPAAAFYTPPLTTVRRDLPAAGQAAVRALVHQLRATDALPSTTVVPAELMRSSKCRHKPGCPCRHIYAFSGIPS